MISGVRGLNGSSDVGLRYVPEEVVEYSFLCNTLYHPFQPENRNKPVFVIGQSSQQLCSFQPQNSYRMTVNDNTYDGNSDKEVETLLNYSKMGFMLVPLGWDGKTPAVKSTLGPLCYVLYSIFTYFVTKNRNILPAWFTDAICYKKCCT
jgi:hypothetical protein